MGRPELGEALASLAAQTATDVEVIVVAASGPQHPVPPPFCGRFPLRFVPGNLPRRRPVAANAGLDAATGAFVGLLDDDDLLRPRHIESLSGVLLTRPDAVAAYSIALETQASGEVIASRRQPFSRLLLFQDCYLASNSVLFRREALADCRFDERLDICEDWDFWLQLAERSDFVFVPIESAIVRPTRGTSGTGRGINRDDRRYHEARALLASKWMEAGRAVAASIDVAARKAFDLYRQGRLTEAEAAADGVLGAFPYDVASLNLKGILLAQRGDAAAALERFERAVAEAPTDSGSWLNLALALEQSGRAEQAISAYDRVLALMPGHPGAMARKSALQRQYIPSMP